jgi:PTS system ascorbate-specific IIB component
MAYKKGGICRVNQQSLKILIICTVGVGSSLMLKTNVSKILSKHNIDAEIKNSDVTTAKGNEADIIITTPDLYENIKGIKAKKIVLLDNIVSKKGVEEKVIPICNELLND